MNATATATPKPHADGGTFTVIASAETVNGWAVAITRWTTYRGAVRFEVRRVAPDNVSLRLGTFNSERLARGFANETWKRDR
jgi:hypothetical protein